MIKLIDLLKEIRINNPSKLSEDVIKAIRNLAGDEYGADDSGFHLDYPYSETFDYEWFNEDDIEGDEQRLAFKYLMNKYSEGIILVSNDIMGGHDAPTLGAPKLHFDTCIEIDEDQIIISVPYLADSPKGFVSAGWFDIKGEYHPDIKNWNEEGDYIGQSLDEIKVNNPHIEFKPSTPTHGSVTINNNNISYEIFKDRDLKEYISIECGYDHELILKYGGYDNGEQDNEDYYPVDESLRVCKNIIKYFRNFNPEIVKDSYDVSYIRILYDDNMKKYIKYDFPEYLGDYKFKWKGKTIRYERADELDEGDYKKGYKIYDDDNDKLIKTILVPNGDIENYMRFLKSMGNSDHNRELVASIINTLV